MFISTYSLIAHITAAYPMPDQTIISAKNSAIRNLRIIVTLSQVTAKNDPPESIRESEGDG
jgi:hypothetical protein